MAGIRGRDTAPELMLRRELHSMGFRFRLHARELPGRPDILLSRWRVAVLVHGCFWHRHVGCRFATTPTTRADFWQTKFDGNVERDVRNHAALLALGWRVATVWECALRKDRLAESLAELADWIKGREMWIDIG